MRHDDFIQQIGRQIAFAELSIERQQRAIDNDQRNADIGRQLRAALEQAKQSGHPAPQCIRSIDARVVTVPFGILAPKRANVSHTANGLLGHSRAGRQRLLQRGRETAYGA
jgi:hypothetical protein